MTESKPNLVIEPTSLDAAKCHTVGSITWVPFPKIITVRTRAELPDEKVKVASVPPPAMVRASVYQWGGVNDCTANPREPIGKGNTRKATKADYAKRVTRRMAAVMANTWGLEGGRSRLVPVPALLAECVAIVRQATQQSVAWEDTVVRPYRAGADTEKGIRRSLAIAWASHGRNKLVKDAATLKRVEEKLVAEAERRIADTDGLSLEGILEDTEA